MSRIDSEGRRLISPSQLKGYATCPRRWFYRTVAELPGDEYSAAAELGSLIHGQIEDCLVYDVQPTHPAAILALKQIRDKRHTAVEVEIRWDIDDTVALRGFVDWVEVHRGHATIIDHKTKASMDWAPTPEELRHDIQLLCYAWMVCMKNSEVNYVTVAHNVVTREAPVIGDYISVDLPRDEVLQAGEEIAEQCKLLARQSKLPVLQVPAKVGPACTMWRRRCEYEEQCIKDRVPEEKVEW